MQIIIDTASTASLRAALNGPVLDLNALSAAVAERTSAAATLGSRLVAAVSATHLGSDPAAGVSARAGRLELAVGADVVATVAFSWSPVHGELIADLTQRGRLPRGSRLGNLLFPPSVTDEATALAEAWSGEFVTDAYDAADASVILNGLGDTATTWLARSEGCGAYRGHSENLAVYCRRSAASLCRACRLDTTTTDPAEASTTLARLINARMGIEG